MRTTDAYYKLAGFYWNANKEWYNLALGIPNGNILKRTDPNMEINSRFNL